MCKKSDVHTWWKKEGNWGFSSAVQDLRSEAELRTQMERSSERNRASNISRRTSATALLKPMSLAMGNRFLRSLTSSQGKGDVEALKHIKALGSSISGHLSLQIELENFFFDRMRSTGVPFFDSKPYSCSAALPSCRTSPS
jgi:autotransporter translocation and assembly factor TamB